MPENHNNAGPKNNVTIDSLNEKSESITDSLENIEGELDIQDDETKVSDDLRVAFLKIKSLSRSNDNPVLQDNYSKILDQYEKLGERSFSSIIEYSKATTTLLVDLSELQTTKGESLTDTDIDGGIFEAGVALVDGVAKAGETIYEEIKGYIEMVGMAGELPSILEKVWDSLSVETFLNIYDALVDMGGDIIRDFSLIMDNSSSTGKTVELSNFIPAIGIPILFEAVGPGKFFKILKIDKLIPENVILAMDGAVTKGKDAAGNIVENGKNMVGNIGKKTEKLDDVVDDIIKGDTELGARGINSADHKNNTESVGNTSNVENISIKLKDIDNQITDIDIQMEGLKLDYVSLNKRLNTFIQRYISEFDYVYNKELSSYKHELKPGSTKKPLWEPLNLENISVIEYGNILNNKKIDLVKKHKELTKSPDNIRKNFSLGREKRINAANELFKYDESFEGFSVKQLDGIIDTHEIGQELFEKYLKENGLTSVSELSDKQIREIFNSKEGRIILRQKMKNLSDLGIKGEDASDLIRSGITGGVGEDFSSLLKQDFVPTSHGHVNVSGNKGNITELFGDTINETQRIIKKADEIKIASRIVKEEITGLSDELNDIGEKIKDLGYILSPKGIKDLSNELNQQYGVILSKYKELGGFNDELNGVGKQMEKFDTVSNTDDVVNRLINRIDFDQGSFDITENNYTRMNNQLQRKLDDFTSKVGRDKINLEIVDEAQSILDNLLKAA